MANVQIPLVGRIAIWCVRHGQMKSQLHVSKYLPLIAQEGVVMEVLPGVDYMHSRARRPGCLAAFRVVTLAMQFDLFAFLLADFAAELSVGTALCHHAFASRMCALGRVGHGDLPRAESTPAGVGS